MKQNKTLIITKGEIEFLLNTMNKDSQSVAWVDITKMKTGGYMFDSIYLKDCLHY